MADEEKPITLTIGRSQILLAISVLGLAPNSPEIYKYLSGKGDTAMIEQMQEMRSELNSFKAELSSLTYKISELKSDVRILSYRVNFESKNGYGVEP